MRNTPVSPSYSGRRTSTSSLREVGMFFPHVIGAYGQLTVTAVDEHSKLYRPRTSAGEHSLDCGAPRSPCEQHVVHQYNVLRRHVKIELRAADKRILGVGGEIVAVKPDVYAAAWHVHALDLLNIVVYYARYRLASAAYTDKHDVVHALVLLRLSHGRCA